MDVSNAPQTVAMHNARRGRWAVAAMFFANGFLTGSWAPQIPVFLTRLEISKLTLGLLILLFGARRPHGDDLVRPSDLRHGSRTS